MVKVRAVTKSKTKPRQDQHTVSGKKGRISASASTSKKVDMNSVPSCSECGVVIDSDTKAVQCEKCVDIEIWMCASCLDLSDDLYDQLATSSKSNLHWFCPKCEDAVLNPDEVTSNNIISSIEQYLKATLSKFEQELLDKVNASLHRKEENAKVEEIKVALEKKEKDMDSVVENQKRVEKKWMD